MLKLCLVILILLRKLLAKPLITMMIMLYMAPTAFADNEGNDTGVSTTVDTVFHDEVKVDPVLNSTGSVGKVIEGDPAHDCQNDQKPYADSSQLHRVEKGSKKIEGVSSVNHLYDANEENQNQDSTDMAESQFADSAEDNESSFAVSNKLSDDNTELVTEAVQTVPVQKKVVQLFPLSVLLVVTCVLIFLIGRHIRRNKDNNRFLTSTRISIMDTEIQLMCHYIEANYADSSLTPASACQALSTGEQFVEALFKKELDMTFAGFITHVRIHHAVNLINDGYKNGSEELMTRCGYLDINLFTEEFFTVTGVKLALLLKHND